MKKSRIKYYLYRFWVFLLSQIKNKIDFRIRLDEGYYAVYYKSLYLSDPVDPVPHDYHAVYFKGWIDDIYICKDGESALALINRLSSLNSLLNREFFQLEYGKIEYVYSYKIFSRFNMVFTWKTTEAERNEVFNKVCNAPLISKSTVS